MNIPKYSKLLIQIAWETSVRESHCPGNVRYPCSWLWFSIHSCVSVRIYWILFVYCLVCTGQKSSRWVIISYYRKLLVCYARSIYGHDMQSFIFKYSCYDNASCIQRIDVTEPGLRALFFRVLVILPLHCFYILYFTTEMVAKAIKTHIYITTFLADSYSIGLQKKNRD